MSTSIITAIAPSARKQGRFELVVNGKPYATVGLEAIETLGLRIGGALDERLSAAVEREAALLATYDRALNMLAMRARSSSELRRLLVRKGELPEHVDAVIERLHRAGFLDDASFARQFSRSKALGAGMSKRRLQQELGRRGVDRAQALDAIEDVFATEEIDEDANLERVARKKLASLAKLDSVTKRRRLYAFLARRGYDLEAIARVSRTLVDSSGEDDDVS